MSFLVLLLNVLSIIILIAILDSILFYVNYVIEFRLNIISEVLEIIVIMVSSIVILNSIDYLRVIEFIWFLVYIFTFLVFMILFILSCDLIIIFLNYEWIGLISYLLINYWASKSNCGIKAVIYNKVGDSCFLLLLAFSYSSLTSISLHVSFSILFNIFFIFIIPCINSSSSWLSIAFLLIYLTKSAQLPFSSWLLNAMSAPTPISALLHSSTMVIAGVYLGVQNESIMLLLIDYSNLYLFILVILALLSLQWSLFKAICINDIKGIIAYSTISQISYMFLVSFIFPLVSLFHIIVHAFFKSLLFLLAGSLIHSNGSYQSIYKSKINNALISILFILGVSVLILAGTKEGIIKTSYIILNSFFIFLIGSIGVLFTSIYSLKIYIYFFGCINPPYAFIRSASLRFYPLHFVPLLMRSATRCSFSLNVIPILTITSILMDLGLDSCFYFSIVSIVNLSTLSTLVNLHMSYSILYILFSLSTSLLFSLQILFAALRSAPLSWFY